MDTSQPAHNVLGTSPKGSLRVLTSGTYRGLQGTNTKIDDLMKKMYYTYIPAFYSKNKFLKVLNRNVHGTSIDGGLNDGTF